MIRPGLCSVTFRDLAVDTLVQHAAASGLTCIEWGGDIHVPPGAAETAQRTRELTEQAGLAVASYGSYLRFTGTESEVQAAGEDVLTSARALGAPRIRVWAHTQGSAATSGEDRARTVRRIQDFADLALESGIDVGLEFHGGTLTDDIDSTLRLLDEVDRESVRTYWQPPVDMPADAALATLRRVLPRLSTVHVFSWWPGSERLPLSARADLWQEVFSLLTAEASDHDALLEFVPGDDPAVLPREAASLRTVIAAGEKSLR